MLSSKLFSVFISFTILASLSLAANETQVNFLVNTQSCLNCFQLSNGKAIPAVGLGTYDLAKTDDKVARVIKDAIEAGYRHIDTADFYRNEKGIGKGLEELLQQGKVKREELFITTKVWSNFHTEELTLKSVRKSLENLKLNYLDLVLIHWPFTFPSGNDYLPKDVNNTFIGGNHTQENYELAYKGLEEAVRLNLTRSIGVSNFNVRQLEKILSVSTIKPVVNQVESHPLLSQQELLDFCKRNGILLEAYSPLRQGDSKLLQNESLKTIATKYGRTVAQVIFRWQLQRGVAVIPKSSKPKRLRENKDVFGFTLTQEEINTINQLNTNDRLIVWQAVNHLEEYPF